jgi:catechol 2,3-dioxygenase-like lactoylglutathione lyase family enzyme
MAFDHVTLPTREFDATVKFVERVLEFPRIAAPENLPIRAAWYDVGDYQQLHVLERVEPDVAAARPASEDEFARHIAFRFPQARWLRIRNQLAAKHVDIIPPKRESDVSRFFVLDPNGYCLEFVCR